MKKIKLCLFFNLISVFIINAQFNYNIEKIPDSLKTNSNAVFRFYNVSYKRISAEKYIKEVHYAVTILNPNGKSASKLEIPYDRNSKVTAISGSYFNREGILQGRLRNKEISDYSTNNQFTLFSDHRTKYFSPAINTYPYTIDYKYVIEYTGIVGFEPWIPLHWFNFSLEFAELIYTTFPEYDIKYKELNYDFIKKIEKTGDLIVYTWTAKNLIAIEEEPRSPNYLDILPVILLSPNEIVYERTRGNFSTWQSYGKWTYNLIQERDSLPKATIDHIKSLTDTIKNTRDKAKAIYIYMQNRTRYVNIALGIGGFQPVSAWDVDAKGYGDCKALSNYTKALLKCAGIHSFYTEIGTGGYQEIKYQDFASANQTNHVILCVPLESDTIWMECTNQKIPFGFLAPGCLNRYALLIKPSGGELVRTPSFNANENTKTSKIDIEINSLGGALFEIQSEYHNNLYAEIFPMLNSSKKEQKEALIKKLSSSKSIEIQNFSIEEKSDFFAQGEIHVDGKINKFANATGSGLLLTPDFLCKKPCFDFIPEKRKLDIFESFGYSYIDTLHLIFPEGYSLDYAPDSKKFNSTYGTCSYHVKKTNSSLTITRELLINEGRYHSDGFREINEFLQNISEYEKNVILLSNHAPVL